MLSYWDLKRWDPIGSGNPAALETWSLGFWGEGDGWCGVWMVLSIVVGRKEANDHLYARLESQRAYSTT